MATGRGWILRQHSLGFLHPFSVSAAAFRGQQSPLPPSFVVGGGTRVRETSGQVGGGGGAPGPNRTMSESSVVTDGQARKLQIPERHKKSADKSSCTISLDRMPSEMLLKILSYLDAATLLCTGCVNKTFYFLSNDNTIWFKIYSKAFVPKRKKWRIEPIQDSLKCLELQDRGLGYWKKEYISKKISDGKAKVFQLLKSVNTYTGLPLKTKEAIKVSGLKWMLILKDRNGKEHKMHQTNTCFNETSVTVFWYNSGWPCLDTLLSLQLFGVTPVLLNETKVVPKNGPWRRSLVSECELSHLTKNAEMIGCDALIELYRIEQGLLVGFWKKNEIAFVMASLHYHQLIERSTLGSATIRHTATPDKAIFDDIDPLYGTHGYQLHIDLHSSGNANMCGTFRNLFCQKDNIRNGYLQFTVISFNNTAQHVPLVGKVGLCWRTDAFEGVFQNCFIMDVTLLDDSQKPFWCFSVPVNMVLAPKPSTVYQYLGPSYFLTYSDSTGKVHMELVWMEETNEYCIINLVFYLSTQKVNSWFGTNY